MNGSGTVIVESLVKTLAARVVSVVSANAQRHDTKIVVGDDDVEAALNHHLTDVSSWSSEISFGDLRLSKSIEEHFVPLDVLLIPRRRHLEGEFARKVSFDLLLKGYGRPSKTAREGRGRDEGSRESSESEGSRHLVILGQPGAGKTTSMKALCRRVLLDPEFLPDELHTPLLIRLREYSTRHGLTRESKKDKRLLIPKVQDILGIRIEYPSRLRAEDQAERRLAIRDRIVIDALDSIRCLLVLDGFDEIIYKSRREAILEEVRLLCSHLKQSVVVLTSRTGEYLVHIEHADEFEISPLSSEQIRSFAVTWLGPQGGADFLTNLARSPYRDTAVRPLTIAHLCAIYERVGKIPRVS